MTRMQELVDAFSAAVDSNDGKAMKQAFGDIWTHARGASPNECVEALLMLAPFVANADAVVAGWSALLSGAIVEVGGPPDAIASSIVERVRIACGDALRLVAAWRSSRDGMLAAPDDFDPDNIPEGVVGDLSSAARVAVTAWRGLGNLCRGLLTVLQRSEEARKAVTDRVSLIRELRDLASRLDEMLEGDGSLGDSSVRLVEFVGNLRFAIDLLRILDDEVVIVLHRSLRRGYQIRITGIGDNFQLHTLLANAVIGPKSEGLIPGKRPDTAWVAVASDGAAPREPSAIGIVRGSFNLVDANGEWIWNEGVPADIPVVGDHRIIVLDPPPYDRGWQNSRRFPQMAGRLSLERILPEHEAEQWLGRVRPPVKKV